MSCVQSNGCAGHVRNTVLKFPEYTQENSEPQSTQPAGIQTLDLGSLKQKY
jgi:hypothetical protein